MKGKVISLPYIFQVLYVLCFTRPRYQVSVCRTIGPLVFMRGAAPHRSHKFNNSFFYPTFMGVKLMLASLFGQAVCEPTLITQLHLSMLEKKRYYTCWRVPTNVIAIILFVGTHPTSILATSEGQTVCEPALIIQLHPCMLDIKRGITFVGAIGCSLSHKCNTFRRHSSDEYIGYI